MLEFDNFSIGLNVQLPSTIEREWSYTFSSTGRISKTNPAGVDKVEIPASYDFGMTFRPVDKLIFSFDFEQTPYSQTTYNLASSYPDSLTQYDKWVDQTAYKFGIEIKVIDNVSLLGGYQSRTTAWIPYGAAFRDRGTPAETFSGGLSYNSPIGQFDLACVYYKLKYYDAFFSNVNYVLATQKRIMMGYTFRF